MDSQDPSPAPADDVELIMVIVFPIDNPLEILEKNLSRHSITPSYLIEPGPAPVGPHNTKPLAG
jgi:hypothetical protein